MKVLRLFIFISCAFISLGLANGDHDIHLSLCELRFNEATSSFEVSIKLFIDDLEAAVEKEGIKDLRIGTPGESPLADEHIASYLDKHFSIEIDGVSLKPVFIGKEMTGDQMAVWCYIEYPKNINNAKRCILTNRIFFEVYDDQRNIMDIRMNKSHKDYTIFERGRNTWSYTY